MAMVTQICLHFRGILLNVTSILKSTNGHDGSKVKHVQVPRLLLGNGSNKWTWKRSIEFNGGSYGYQATSFRYQSSKLFSTEAVVFDIDNDGDQDVVANVVGRLYVGGYITVFENDGNGNFSVKQTHIGRTPRQGMIDTDSWKTSRQVMACKHIVTLCLQLISMMMEI